MTLMKIKLYSSQVSRSARVFLSTKKQQQKWKYLFSLPGAQKPHGEKKRRPLSSPKKGKKRKREKQSPWNTTHYYPCFFLSFVKERRKTWNVVSSISRAQLQYNLVASSREVLHPKVLLWAQDRTQLVSKHLGTLHNYAFGSVFCAFGNDTDSLRQQWSPLLVKHCAHPHLLLDIKIKTNTTVVASSYIDTLFYTGKLWEVGHPDFSQLLLWTAW